MASRQIFPFRLAPFFSPRVWGTSDLSPWYDLKSAEKIGEAWLTGEMCKVETGPLAGKTLADLAAQHPAELLGETGTKDFPLLIKILFPHDKLSVQVHPDDALAAAFGETRGKTECWYVLDAKPGASVSLGLKPGTSLESIRAAVDDQSLEDLLEQVPVEKDDMIFVDAGTVHAIGPGVTLLETQQTSDLTYRLYDYGRPRELHVDRALQVTRLQTEAGKIKSTAHRENGTEVQRLIAQQYFTVDRLELGAGTSHISEHSEQTPHALVAVEGAATLVAEGQEPVEVLRGQAVIVPAGTRAYQLHVRENCALVRSTPPAVRV